MALTLAWLLALSVWDLRERRIPNRLVLWACGSLLASLLVEWLVFHQGAFLPLLLIAGAVLFVMGTVVQSMSPDGLGGGDVKVFSLMGLSMGILGFGGLFAREMATGFYVALRWLLLRRSLREPIPLIPFLAVGSLVVSVLSSIR